MNTTRKPTNQTKWAALALLLLLAALLRFWALGDVPPGLSHDEVANALIARDISAGHHALYFTAAYGHEPLYQYIQAASVALLGENWLGLRYPSAALGLLGLAATVALLRRLFGPPTALLGGAWLALAFWPLFYARVGLRAITLPLTAALAALYLLRATDVAHPNHRHRPPRRRDWALAGLWLGVSLYTYMAARVLPLIVAAYLAYLYLVRRSDRPDWRGLLTLALIAAAVAAPLLGWLATHPGAEYRVAEVREPLDRLLAGDPSLALENLLANLKMFTFTGDPWAHQNLPGRPVLGLLGGLLFYAGLLIALWHWRQPRYGFALIWLAGALVPSILSAVAPSSIRDILALVVTFAFPALAAVHGLRLLRGRGPALAAARLLLLALPLLVVGTTTARDYFVRWPQNDVARFFYQSDLVAVAQRIDTLDPDTPLVVAGLSVHSMDRPTLEIAARRDVADVRLCDSRETLLLPAAGGLLLLPRVVPLDEGLRQQLLTGGATVAEETSAFVAYSLPAGAELCGQPPPEGETVFGDSLALVGYEWLAQTVAPGSDLVLLTCWRVRQPPPQRLKLFVHLTAADGTLIAQHDGLGSSPRGWAAGDLLVQRHVITLPADIPPGPYTILTGVYEADSGTRLPVGGADHLLLTVLEGAE